MKKPGLEHTFLSNLATSLLPSGGLRIFQEVEGSDGECFTEMNVEDTGRLYSKREIDAIAEQGWQVWLVLYGASPYQD